jgi:hypothetical protein
MGRSQGRFRPSLGPSNLALNEVNRPRQISAITHTVRQLLATFVLIERRQPSPLVALRISSTRSMSAASVTLYSLRRHCSA